MLDGAGNFLVVVEKIWSVSGKAILSMELSKKTGGPNESWKREESRIETESRRSSAQKTNAGSKGEGRLKA